MGCRGGQSTLISTDKLMVAQQKGVSRMDRESGKVQENPCRKAVVSYKMKEFGHNADRLEGNEKQIYFLSKLMRSLKMLVTNGERTKFQVNAQYERPSGRSSSD